MARLNFTEKKSTQFRREFVYFVLTSGITAGVIVGTVVFFVPHVRNIKLKFPTMNFSRSHDTSSQINIEGKKINDIEYADPWLTLSEVWKHKNNNVIIIDLRNEKDYQKHNFKNTVNIVFPYGKQKDEYMVFLQNVKKKAKGYDTIVLLPYSGMSLSGEEAYDVLKKGGLKHIRLLKIGWNEMYNLPNLWIPEHSWGTFTVSTYINSSEN